MCGRLLERHARQCCSSFPQGPIISPYRLKKFNFLQKSIVKWESDVLVVNSVVVFGIKCSFFGCNEVIDEQRISRMVDEKTTNKFHRLSLNQYRATLEKLHTSMTDSYMRTNTSIFRMCPRCRVQIEKNGGYI